MTKDEQRSPNDYSAAPKPDSLQSSQSVDFPHPSEREFACILDFYQIPWLYEPTTFALEWDEEGNVKEAFTPDFYLPDQDLYIELTTLRSGLMNRKYRKLRRLIELYPNIRIKLVDRRHFANLLFKYGLEDEEQRLVGRSALDNGGEKER